MVARASSLKDIPRGVVIISHYNINTVFSMLLCQVNIYLLCKKGSSLDLGVIKQKSYKDKLNRDRTTGQGEEGSKVQQRCLCLLLLAK